MRDIRIAYIGGGSRGWAWTFMTDLALDKDISGTIRLYDIDEEAAEKNAFIGNHLMARPEAEGDWNFIVSHSLEEALSGCDFVAISNLIIENRRFAPSYWGRGEACRGDIA